MAEKISPPVSDRLKKRLQKIKLVAMDIDGVLTAGEIVVLESGEEIKMWNAKDRLLMALIRDHGQPLVLAFLTGRRSRAVAWSARDLGISHVVQHCQDKRSELKKILDRHKWSFDEAAFIGDDLIDLKAMDAVGFSACPSDAARDVRERADYVSSFPGGQGVARDVLELILRAQNKWESLISAYLP